LRTFTDPITGDELSLGEKAAWIAQGTFRRWSVMILLQVICVVWLVLGTNAQRGWFNYVWSDLAIIVENVTMLALFNQTRRDAKVQRDTKKIVAHLEALLDHHGIES
jgi:hypothetical protein